MTTHPDAASVSLEAEFEEHRRALTGYCYRMLGSNFEADDAVQETFVRAWRAFDKFEGRSSVKSWLFSIATNVCLDSLNGRKRRAMPMDLGAPPNSGDGAAGPIAPEMTWIQPMADDRVVDGTDPAEVLVARETIKLAFVRSLQLLPPRQRAVLILRDVLRWQASEVATLLDASVASVNSALQRAHATLDDNPLPTGEAFQPLDAEQKDLLARYVDAFERYDMDALVEVLHEDVVVSMPPFEMWMLGPQSYATFCVGAGAECDGSILRPMAVNGHPGFAQWKPNPAGDGYVPWSIHVLEINDGKITGLTFFVDADLFPAFGLPESP